MKDLQKSETFVVDAQYIDTIITQGLAHDVFGRVRRVTKIFAHDLDVNGKEFICYYTELRPTSAISHSVKIGKPFSWIDSP